METRKDYCKIIKRGEYLKPQNPFEENYYICWVFNKCFKGKPRTDILEKLIELSKVFLAYPKTYRQKRRRKHGTGGKCFVCSHLNAVCHHHIILLKNGGMDTSWNRIKICKECHKIIHPWIH